MMSNSVEALKVWLQNWCIVLLFVSDLQIDVISLSIMNNDRGQITPLSISGLGGKVNDFPNKGTQHERLNNCVILLLQNTKATLTRGVRGLACTVHNNKD
jgi:hypothetical protein